jgi:hypothetical protein
MVGSEKFSAMRFLISVGCVVVMRYRADSIVPLPRSDSILCRALYAHSVRERTYARVQAHYDRTRAI